MIPVQRRLKVPHGPLDDALYQFGCEIRVAIPGIIQSFDPGPQYGFPSVSVAPAIREVLNQDAAPTITDIPILDAVPVLLPGGGGWNLTVPIEAGDECLLVFSDMAIDYWKQNGGVQKQPDGVKFRHDLWDAVAIVGLRSRPRGIANWSTTSAQLRSDDGTVVLDLAAAGITGKGPAVSMGNAGPYQPLVTMAWYVWFTTYVLPHITLPPGTPPPPVNSVTTIFEAE